MKIICLLNPIAGRGRAPKKWETCLRAFDKIGLEVETLVTTSSGDAKFLAQKAVEKGIETIVIAGGDGTINEVIGAVVGSEVKIAIAPFGTGNDLARGLGMPFDEIKWANEFLSFKTRRIDLGVVNGHYFANQAGFGFDAQVGHKINSGINFLTGKLAYLVAVASCLRDLKAIDVEISIDGTILKKKVVMVTFANSPYVGGGLMTAPKARSCDGYLDLFILGEVSRLELIRSFPLLLKGTHGKHPAVSFYRGREFSVRTASEQYIHIDGEIQKGKNLEVSVMPNCVNFLVP